MMNVFLLVCLMALTEIFCSHVCFCDDVRFMHQAEHAVKAGSECGQVFDPRCFHIFCGGQLMAPKDAHTLNTGICKYGILCGKRDFQGVIQ